MKTAGNADGGDAGGKGKAPKNAFAETILLPETAFSQRANAVQREPELQALWRDAGWGWAMWNFRGDFGPLDSKRSDVPYETFHGHQLDRAMLEMIRAY